MTQLDENGSGSRNAQKRPADDVFDNDIEQFLNEDFMGNSEYFSQKILDWTVMEVNSVDLWRVCY